MKRKTHRSASAVVALSTAISAPLAQAEFGDDPLAGLKMPTMLADASGQSGKETASAEAETDTAGISELCAELRADRDADLGRVLRAGCEPTLAQMSRLMDNPIGNVAMLFNQYDAYNVEEPETGIDEFQHNYMLLAQFPKKLNDDWNLINRVVLNYTSVPLDQNDLDNFVPPPEASYDDFDYQTLSGISPATAPPNTPLPVQLFEGRTTNLGDSYYVGLFAPAEPTVLPNDAKFLWGVGFDLGFDTAADDVLGTGKWTAGPSALGVYFGEVFKGGALIQQYWDYAGDGDRDDVNVTNIQTFYYWGLNDTTSIGAGPNIIANWEQNSDNTWTVPVGIGVSKTLQFGKIPVRVGLEYHHTVIEPDDIPGTDWSVRFYIIPAAPSALFEWMQ